MENQEIVEVLVKAASVIMDEDPTLSPSQALLKAKEGLKQYIALRVEATHEFVAAGYSEEAALRKSAETVNLAIAMRKSA